MGNEIRFVSYTVTTTSSARYGSDESQFAKSQDSVHKPHLLNRKESQSGELVSWCFEPSQAPEWGIEPTSIAYQHHALTARPNRLILVLRRLSVALLNRWTRCREMNRVKTFSGSVEREPLTLAYTVNIPVARAVGSIIDWHAR